MKLQSLIAILVTIIIFALIFQRISIESLASYIGSMDIVFLGAYLLFFVPIIFFGALRWKVIISGDSAIGMKEALNSVLLATSMNIITPSRLGDFSKAHYMKKTCKVPLSKGVSLVFAEKMTDIFSLFFLSLLGIFFLQVQQLYPVGYLSLAVIVLFSVFVIFLNRTGGLFSFLAKSRRLGKIVSTSFDSLTKLRGDRKLLAKIILLTMVIWVLNITQICFIFLAFSLNVPILAIFGLMPIALVIGMIPVTIAGMGTRDSAIIMLFSGFAPSAAMLSVSFFCTVRYIIPALFGLPSAKKYIELLK